VSDVSSGQPPPGSNRANTLSGFLGRERLARLVVLGSFLTIFLLVAVLIGIAQGGSARAAETAEKTFNAILPVLAGWVGIVLAFYFSAQSNERTSNSLDQAINQATGNPAQGATVAETMIPLSSIRRLYHLDRPGSARADIKLTDLESAFNDPSAGGPITRLVFVDNAVFRYVLHVGTFNTYLRAHPTPPTPEPTFADLLTDSDTLRQISQLVVFVPASATLGDAKTALDAINGAQDIIVTGTGNASGPMLGWITNVDLIKALTVS
jgi:hypothetical protein